MMQVLKRKVQLCSRHRISPHQKSTEEVSLPASSSNELAVSFSPSPGFSFYHISAELTWKHLVPGYSSGQQSQVHIGCVRSVPYRNHVDLARIRTIHPEPVGSATVSALFLLPRTSAPHRDC